MKYALLDWDNTLRENYTLFCWIDYLVEKKIITVEQNKRIKVLLDKYENKHISHEQLAKLACLEYANAIKGIEVTYLFSVIKEFNKSDKLNMYSFVPKLFEILLENDIYPIVISGAPIDIISTYFKKYQIKEAYGFECEILNKHYTGKVKCNYGFNKMEIVKKLQKKIGSQAYLAMGDSESDFPMLDNAKYGFLLNQKVKNKDYIFVTERTVLREVNKILNLD